jgi:hypothetical protein
MLVTRMRDRDRPARVLSEKIPATRVARAVDQCSVKRHLASPPGFDVVVRLPELALTGSLV